jgi:hypothetical protein
MSIMFEKNVNQPMNHAGGLPSKMLNPSPAED